MKIKITNIETKENYTTDSVASLNSLKDQYGKYFRSSEINRIVDAGSVELHDEYYQAALRSDTTNGHVIVEKPAEQTATGRWQDSPATQKQYDYIRTLGYYDFQENMTKGQASYIINMIKSGEAGSLNMMRYDGSY